MADFADATSFLDVFFRGATLVHGSPHEEVIELLNKGNSTFDPAERQAIYDEANQLIQDLAISAPIVHNSHLLQVVLRRAQGGLGLSSHDRYVVATGIAFQPCLHRTYSAGPIPCTVGFLGRGYRMTRYIVQRLVLLIPALIGIAIVTVSVHGG